MLSVRFDIGIVGAIFFAYLLTNFVAAQKTLSCVLFIRACVIFALRLAGEQIH
ncbi:MAG: putative membrane protein YeaQ/YmgE (transglycosylase-associated protein family) [Candidatus Omnitrophota bacterium]|jgi:uncharacterized membrane protein YeaQ/YmgE (transglycosylase-associated protein family)